MAIAAVSMTRKAVFGHFRGENQENAVISSVEAGTILSRTVF
jgi:hypothetical protein